MDAAAAAAPAAAAAVVAGGALVELHAGELLHLECSWKYSEREVAQLAVESGLQQAGSWHDASHGYGLHLFGILQPANSSAHSSAAGAANCAGGSSSASPLSCSTSAHASGSRAQDGKAAPSNGAGDNLPAVNGAASNRPAVNGTAGSGPVSSGGAAGNGEASSGPSSGSSGPYLQRLPCGAPVPSWQDWQRLWRLWDAATLVMVDARDLQAARPIPLRNPLIFYLGHTPAFLNARLSRVLGACVLSM